MSNIPHGMEQPSAWVQRWSHLVREGGVVLDVACGYGRHARWFHGRNHPLVLVDRSQEDVDGALVGGASLEAESFAKIVNYR